LPFSVGLCAVFFSAFFASPLRHSALKPGDFSNSAGGLGAGPQLNLKNDATTLAEGRTFFFLLISSGSSLFPSFHASALPSEKVEVCGFLSYLALSFALSGDRALSPRQSDPRASNAHLSSNPSPFSIIAPLRSLTTSVPM